MATKSNSRTTINAKGSAAKGSAEFSDPKEDVRGLVVLDKNGETLGQVEELLVDEQQDKVRFLQIKSGGFLGLGHEMLVISVDTITRVDDTHIHINQTRQTVAEAPAYDPNLPMERQEEYWRGIYVHYGLGPFWGPGYVYPPYPYY